jgi:hypothetical protein
MLKKVFCREEQGKTGFLQHRALYKNLVLQGIVARLEGLEPPTLCFEGRCSIQLSYRRAVVILTSSGPTRYFVVDP